MIVDTLPDSLDIEGCHADFRQYVEALNPDSPEFDVLYTEVRIQTLKRKISDTLEDITEGTASRPLNSVIVKLLQSELRTHEAELAMANHEQWKGKKNPNFRQYLTAVKKQLCIALKADMQTGGGESAGLKFVNEILDTKLDASPQPTP